MPTKILLLLLIICFLEGCSSERRKYISDREIKEIIINPEKTEDYLDISEVLSDSIDIIPLEVTENCLISDIKKLEFYKNRIFISDRINAKIFVFDSEGNFLRSIGKQGRGPGEYSYMGDFSFKGDSVIIQDLSRKKYIVYDLYSSGYREILYDPHHLEVVVFDSIAYFISNYEQSKYGAFNLAKFDLDKSEIVSLGIPFDKGGLDKSGYGLKRYASKCGDDAMLIYPLNDTVYSVNRDEVFPSYMIRFTSRNLPDNLDIDRDALYGYVHKNNYLKGLEYMQNSHDYLLGYYADNYYFRYCIYNKSESDIRVGNRLIVKSLGGIWIHEFCIMNNNDFVFFQYADILSSNWNYVRDKSDNIRYKKELDSIISNMNEDSNPVVFKCHFKNARR